LLAAGSLGIGGGGKSRTSGIRNWTQKNKVTLRYQ